MKKHFYKIAILAMSMGVSACSFSEDAHQQRIAEHFSYQYQGLENEKDETFEGKKVSAKVAKKTRKSSFKDDEKFDTASISDDKLSNMRGGFVSVSGIRIDFGLYTQTTINNNIVSNLMVSTNGLNGIMPGSLQQLIQSGSGNQATVSSADVPGNVLNVVQNTSDNQLIQNTNVLDITVSNLSAYRDQQIGSNIRFITLAR